jgi:hypothetical protein
MPKITINGQLQDEVYADAINQLPYSGASIASIIASHPKNQPCTPKKAFEKTCDFMRHTLKPGEQQQRLQASARNLLINKYGYNPAVLDCCNLRIKNNALELKSDGRFKSLIKNAPDMGRSLMDKLEKRMSDAPKAAAEKEDVLMRIAQHQTWLRDRERILGKAQELFGMDETTLREFAGSLPDHRANLSGMTLRDMDLSGYNLTGIICKGAKIENCVLGNISGADLTGSAIFNTKFVGTDMSHARLNNTRLDHTTVENYNKMTGADFTGSNQHCVNFIGCNFEGAILSEQMAKDLQSSQRQTPVQAQPLAYTFDQYPDQQQEMESPDQDNQESESPVMAM